MLAKLVEHDQVARKAAASLTIGRLDLVPLAGLKPDRLLAVDLDRLVGQVLQVGIFLDEIEAALPDLLGSVEILSGTEDQRNAKRVDEKQGDDLRYDRLAVLAGHQHDDLAEPEQWIERAALAHGGDGPHRV